MRRSLWVVLGVVLWVGCAPAVTCDAAAGMSDPALCYEGTADARPALCYSPGASPAACSHDQPGMVEPACDFDAWDFAACVDGEPACPDGWALDCPHPRFGL